MRCVVALCVIVSLLGEQCDGRWLYFGSDDPVVVTTTPKPAVMSKRLDTVSSDQQTRQAPVPLSAQGGSLPAATSTGTNGVNVVNGVGQPTVESSYASSIFGYVDDSAKYALKKVGNYVPIKSVASMAADLGIPGGEYVVNALYSSEPVKSTYTPLVFGSQSTAREPNSGISPKFAMARSDSPEDPLTTTAAPLPSFREEVSSLMGSMYGEKECVKKLACLSGKRLSNVRGSWAITVGLTSVAGMMPDSLQDPYNALKNSIMYTDDCSQYHCREEPNTDL